MASNINHAKNIKECDYYVPVEKVENLLANSKFSVGHLITAEAIPPNDCPIQGTISMYEMTNDIFGLMTNNHVMPRIDLQFVCGSTINFKGFGQLVLTPDDIRCVTTSEELDATVIELKERCVSALKQRCAQFLKITSAQLNHQVAMVQYPYGLFCYDKGVIHEIIGKDLHYYIASDFGSSGSPILLWDLHAIGLHIGQDPNADKEIHGSMRIATHLPDIVTFHLEKRNSAIMYAFDIIMYLSNIQYKSIISREQYHLS